MEIQRSVTFSLEEVWPIAFIPSADISSDQTKIQRLLSLIPGRAETEGRAHFQYFHFPALSKSLKPKGFLRYFLSLGNNMPALYFMIKISEYESFQNLKKDTDLSTVEWFPKSRPMYWVGALHPRSWKILGHILVLICKKPELWVPGEL